MAASLSSDTRRIPRHPLVSSCLLGSHAVLNFTLLTSSIRSAPYPEPQVWHSLGPLLALDGGSAAAPQIEDSDCEAQRQVVVSSPQWHYHEGVYSCPIVLTRIGMVAVQAPCLSAGRCLQGGSAVQALVLTTPDLITTGAHGVRLTTSLLNLIFAPPKTHPALLGVSQGPAVC